MGVITDILKEIPLSAVLKERIVGYEKAMSILEVENKELKLENATLKAEKEINDKFHEDLLKGSRMRWGCITFPPDKKLYCPSCFHKTGKKIQTSRVDTRSRFCPACKTNLPSG